MTTGLANWTGQQPALSPTAAQLRLLFVAVLLSATLSAIGLVQHGAIGAAAGLIAVLVCYGAAASALALAGLARGPNAALVSLAGGMFLRMGLPLGLGVYLMRNSADLAAAGLFGFIVVAYLTVLAVETVLSLRVLRAREQLEAG